MDKVITNRTNRILLSRIVDFLEYMFLLTVIAECNSMFSSVKLTDTNVSMSSLFSKLTMGLLVVLLVLHVLLDRKVLKKLLGYLPFFIFLLIYISVFYWLNVVQVSRTRRQNYIKVFMILLPLMVLLFKIKQKKGEGLDLLYKYSDIVCIIGAASFMAYLISVCHINTMVSDPLYTKWGGHGSVYERINILNICQFIPGNSGQWQIEGITLLRNNGFFVETLMFSIPLITALSTELFLRKRADYIHVYKAVLLSLVLLTANSTIGMMLMSVVWAFKAVSVALEKRKYFSIVIILCVVAGICALFFKAKKSITYEANVISENSIGDHIEDFRAALKAFFHKPFLGGGYKNEAYIREFMNPAKVSRNPGLSNSAAVVLGEGGIMLGLLCTLPYLLCLPYCFRKEKWGKDIALWVIGPLGLFVGIIFIFHLYLMFLMAFGYALVEVKWEKGKKLPLRLALADFGDALSESPAQRETRFRHRKRTGILAGGAVVAGAIITCFGVPAYKALHVFMRTHQFYMGQSAPKAFCFSVVLLFHGVCVRSALRREISWKRLAGLLVWDAVYLFAYPRLYSDTVTLLTASHSSNALFECAALLFYYGAGSFLVLDLPVTRKQYSGLKIFISTTVIAGAVALFFVTQSGLARLEAPDPSLVSAIQDLTDTAEGKVYADELSSLHHRINREVSYSTCGMSGYDVCEDVSVVCKTGNDRWELFDGGFEVTKLTEDYLVYTNDESIVSRLSEQGMQFYRYYPYDRPVDLKSLAKKNKLKRTSGGAVVIGGEKSLETGPEDTLRKGRYTIVYELGINPDDREGLDGETKVCTLAVCNRLKRNIALQDIQLAQFNAKGTATISLPFELNTLSNGIDYKALGSSEIPVRVRSITIRQTPLYITDTVDNCYGMPIRETYFNPDGSPYVQSGGYHAIERDYNLKCQVTAIRFYGTDMKPVISSEGYAEARYEYNGKGSKVREAYYGTDGGLVVNRHHYASICTDYDSQGNARSIRYLGTKGELTVSDSGYAEIRRAYNSRRQVIREEYYGADGQPLMQTSGYSIIEQEYDDSGNLTAQRFFDENGPVLRTDGYAEVRRKYNGMRQVVQEAFFGTEGEPVMVFNRYSSEEREYDAFGNVIVNRYYDTEDAPVINIYGYAQLRRAYNEKRQVVREDYYGVDGLPILLSNGCAAVEKDYNEFSSVKAQRCFGLTGEAILNVDGYFEVRREFDSVGHVIAEAYFDTQGMPIVCRMGYASLRRVYDDRDLLLEEYLFDENGASAHAGAGYSHIVYKYTEDRQLSLVNYLDENGNLANAGSGYLHVYLQSLLNRDLTVFISAKDEATNALTVTTLDDLKALGIQTELRGRIRNSFYAVISPDGVEEAVGSQDRLILEGTIGDIPYSIVSAGFQVGNYSSIVIDGTEYSKNGRGLNIVVYDNAARQVIDSVVFDTYVQEMTVRR